MKKILFVIVLQILIVDAFSQGMQEFTVEFRPAKFSGRFVKEEWLVPPLLVPNMPKSASPWQITIVDGQVRSFRQGSRTSEYTTKQFKFGEQFYVIDINDSEQLIRIARSESAILHTRLSNAEDYGWIPVESALLWNRCLRTLNNVNSKAMILYRKVGDSLQLKDGEEIGTVRFLDSPDPGGSTIGTTVLFEFFHVHRRMNGFTLLGNPDVHSKEDVKGWVDDRILTPWNHRLALEPNWDEASKEERRSREGIKCFGNEEDASRFNRDRQSSGREVIYMADPAFLPDSHAVLREGRPIGQWRRFPLLEDLTVSDQSGHIVYGLGVMGAVSKDSGFSEEDRAKIINDTKIAIDKVRKVNVVFVVDGTLSMEPYHMAISRAIARLIDETESNENNFRYGGGCLS